MQEGVGDFKDTKNRTVKKTGKLKKKKKLRNSG